MDRFVDVLGETELDPTRTNDLKSVDFFRILENFILETLRINTNDLSKIQLRQFVLQFEKYLQIAPFDDKNEHDERAHLVKRRQFVKKVEKEKWVEKLKEKFSKMD